MYNAVASEHVEQLRKARFNHREALTAFAGVDPGVDDISSIINGSTMIAIARNPYNNYSALCFFVSRSLTAWSCAISAIAVISLSCSS